MQTETLELSDRYRVEQISSKVGKQYIRDNHYSGTCHNGPMCWGLLEGDRLVGVCAFATPCSENVRRSLFGPEHKDRVTELHRLFVEDGTPKCTESWFISRALKGLLDYRPNIRGVISFADSTEGHIGTIYQATNAVFSGTTGRARFWRDPEGRLRHPRQSGHNVTVGEAKEMGWTPEYRDSKYRYVFVVGTPAERRKWRKRLLLEDLPYPER